MTHKKPFEEAWHEFAQAHAEEAKQLSPEQIAEQTGYSLATVKDYFERHRREEERQTAEKRRREQEAGAVIYTTSTGRARVVYYPVLGSVKIESDIEGTLERNWGRNLRTSEESYDYATFLGPQEAIEIGIYLLGLQPHMRDIQAKGVLEIAPYEPKRIW